MAIWIISALSYGYHTQTCPKTKALIYESSMTKNSVNQESKNNTYQVLLRYKYQVRNVNYSNKQIYLTDIPLLTEEQASDLVKYYSVGTIHDVYFDNTSPSNSVLKTGVSSVLILFAAPTLLFLGIGLSARRR
ncbi:MAG: hypothetical protein ACI9CE_002286 [Flavobacterium sp.]|jgi:hypothetical protein